MATRRKASPLRENRYLRRIYRDKGFFTSRRVRWGMLAVALALYTAHFIGGDRGLLRRIGLEKELQEAKAFNAFLAAEKEDLLSEVELREKNPLSLEKMAREKFWMAYEDELIYGFEDDEGVPELSSDGRELWEYPPEAGDEKDVVVEMEAP